jgi:VanZ family protein
MRISPKVIAALPMVWMAVIFVMSAQPDSGEQSGWLLSFLLGPLGDYLGEAQRETIHHLLRKAAHFTEYAILAGLLVWNSGTDDRALRVAWSIAALYAISDELHQRFVPGRAGALGDVLIDSAGALALVVIIHFRVKLANASPVAR